MSTKIQFYTHSVCALYYSILSSLKFVKTPKKAKTHTLLCSKSFETIIYLCERGALHIFDGLQLLGELFALLRRYGLELVLGELVKSGGLFSQVDLCAHEKKGRLLTVVQYFGHPLLFDVLVR